jgi:hypothetical protein
MEAVNYNKTDPKPDPRMDASIDKFMKSEGVTDFEIEDFQSGVTMATKRILTAGTNRYFVKTGEKVDLEAVSYGKVRSSLFCTPLFAEGRTIILPYVKGMRLDDIVFEKDRLPEEKIKICRDIINQVSEDIWFRSVRNRGSNVREYLEQYILSHSIQPGCNFSCDGHEVTLEELLTLPVSLDKNGQVYSLPSFNSMTSNVVERLANLAPKFSTIILGDFQPVNIIVKDDSTPTIVDLANVLEENDYALDFGKFFNYFNRFYMVARLRDSRSTWKSEASCHIHNGKVYIRLTQMADVVLNNLFRSMEESLARKYALSQKDFSLPDRTKLYKYIICLITINRHLAYPWATDLLFACLADAYLEVMTKVETI